MATFETNGDKRPANPSGVYRHPDTGEELITQATAKFGNPQADAITRLGFVYVGPLSEEKRKELQVGHETDPTAKPVANTSPSQKSVTELEAELAAAKEREAAVLRATKDSSDLVDAKDAKSVAADVQADKKGAK